MQTVMFNEGTSVTGLPRDGSRAGHQKVTVSLLTRIGLQELQLGRVHVHPHSCVLNVMATYLRMAQLANALAY